MKFSQVRTITRCSVFVIANTTTASETLSLVSMLQIPIKFHFKILKEIYIWTFPGKLMVFCRILFSYNIQSHLILPLKGYNDRFDLLGFGLNIH